VIGQIGIDGATGHVIEYTGEAVRGLSMEGRMTLCNMSIEAGARAAMIAPDETTFAYMKGRRFAPRDWDEAVSRWRGLASDQGARYDAVAEIDASQLAPFVTWGTNPGMIAPVDGRIPELRDLKMPADRPAVERMLEYMGLEAGTRIEDISVYRLLHQLAAGRLAGRGSRRQGTSRCSQSQGHGRTWVAGGKASGRTGRPAQDFSGLRVRMERIRVLDVSGDEPGYSATWRALRFDKQSQF
jgi:hypothetical protein